MGSVLVETTIVFPVFILLAFGTVDVALMLYDWNLASKADYVGARTAVVSDPVAQGITSLSNAYDPTLTSNLCYVPSASTFTSTGDCPIVPATVCTGAGSGGSCTSGYLFDSAAFTTIYSRMKAIFPRLQPTNIVIKYTPNGLGFVGRPGGLPMNVTVELQCVTHQFFFLGALMDWSFPTPTDLSGNTCQNTPPGWLLPSFVTKTTLTSEDMATN